MSCVACAVQGAKDQHHNTGVVAVVLPHPQHSISQRVHQAHTTLVYAGDYEDVPDEFRAGIHDTVRLLSRTVPPFDAHVTGYDSFDNGSQPVVLLASPLLQFMRSHLEKYNGSEHKTYRPHLSIPEMPYPGSFLTPTIPFDRIGMWAGEHRYLYHLGSGRPAAI